MKKNHLYLLITFITVSLFLFYGCKKKDTPEPEELLLGDQELPYTWRNWMGHVADSIYLNQLTIPGTHDAGADKHTSDLGSLVAPFAICQDFSIPSQLALGVRWFDIRLCYDDNLTLHHSDLSLAKNFKDVLHYCVVFLNDHPTETVILMIKQEHSNASDKDFSEKVYSQIQDRGLYNFFLEDRVPKLGEVRGLIYIVRRFHKEFSHSLGVYADWPDNTTGSYHEYNGIGWYVQDHYSLNTVSDNTKYQEVKHNIQLAHEETYNNVFHLNFVSGERVASGETLWETAEYINPMVDDYIKDLGDSYTNCGVIMINFAGGGDVSSGPRNCVPHFLQHILERNDGVPY
ncbi:MAG: hypothetical protein IH598_12755 [Bacteroidales bacterium]|nr:hypothetical protein [Bacteroidales bacterium]